MIREYCSFSCSGGLCRIAASRPELFDAQVLEPPEEDSPFLPVIRMDRSSCAVYCSSEGLPDLKTFLQCASFTLSEALCFLHQLFEKIAAGMKTQPVFLSGESIFLDPCGSEIRLVRAPLCLDCWMKQEDDRIAFYDELLELFEQPLIEVYGLLFAARKERSDFETLCRKIETLHQNLFSRFRFFRKPIPPYRSRQPVCAIEETPSASFQMPELMPQESKMPLQVREPDLSMRFFGYEAPVQEKAPADFGCLDLNIAKARAQEPTCIVPPAQSARLEGLQGTLVLAGSELKAGRQPSCQLCLEDSTVSAEHALLSCEEGRWYIRDLKSTNGTWIDGKRICRRMRLKEGMRIAFGKQEFTFHE